MVVISLAGLSIGRTHQSGLGDQTPAKWPPGTVVFEVNCPPGREFHVRFYSESGKHQIAFSGTTEQAPPRITGKKTLGALGQTKQETAIYLQANISSKVVYRTASMEYLIIKPSKSEGWLAVPLQNGMDGYIIESLVAKLPYDATVDATSASPSDKSLVVITPDRVSKYASAKVIGVGKYQMVVDFYGGLAKCLSVSVKRDVTNIGSISVQFGDSDDSGRLDNGDIEYIKNLLNTDSNHPLWYKLDSNDRAPFFADANFDGVINAVDLNLVKTAKQKKDDVARGSKGK